MIPNFIAAMANAPVVAQVIGLQMANNGENDDSTNPWRRSPSRKPKIAEVWGDEREQLMAMPPPFDGFVEDTKRVSPTCLVSFDRNRYSVPAAFANRPVSLRAYAERVVIAAEGRTAYSSPIRSLIPAQGDHPFQVKPITDSSAWRSPFQLKPITLRSLPEWGFQHGGRA